MLPRGKGPGGPPAAREESASHPNQNAPAVRTPGRGGGTPELLIVEGVSGRETWQN